jgi:hypothetical protein
VRGGIAPTHSHPRWVSVTPRPRFTPGDRTPGTHWTGGWVGPRAGLDTPARGKILYLCRGSNLDRLVVQPVGRHYTTELPGSRNKIYQHKFSIRSQLPYTATHSERRQSLQVYCERKRQLVHVRTVTTERDGGVTD